MPLCGKFTAVGIAKTHQKMDFMNKKINRIDGDVWQHIVLQ